MANATKPDETLAVFYLFLIITFIGYSTPLILLIGWYPDDAILWFVTIENLFVFSIGWVVYFLVFKRDDNGNKLSKKEYIKKCRKTNIIRLSEIVLFTIETLSIVFLGVLVERYKDDPEARAEYTIIPAIIFKILQIVGAHSCIIKISNESGQKATTEDNTIILSPAVRKLNNTVHLLKDSLQQIHPIIKDTKKNQENNTSDNFATVM